MAVRLSKCLLLASIALFYTLIVFNNLTDYNTNFQFVRHVLSMDTLLPGNHSLWRAIHSSSIHTAFYAFIILWEAVAAALCWWATLGMLRVLRASTTSFAHATHLGTAALTLGMLLWFTAFIVIGGEWFLMWQSRIWNGQAMAFHNFVLLGIVLLYLNLPESTPPHESVD
jgi:predicted small integral membrane protein